MTPILAQVFLTGLDRRILGRLQRTMFSLIADFLRGRFQTMHDTRRSVN
jgi:hypothetical protein